MLHKKLEHSSLCRLMKKIIIIKHGGGELANQLWNYASVYSYAKEQNAELINDSFYEYGNYFPNLHQERVKIIDRYFFKAFTGNTQRRSSMKKKLYRLVYGIYASIICLVNTKNVIKSRVPYLLTHGMLEGFNRIYLDGWLFRNPRGLKRHRNEIIKHFEPTQEIISSVNNFVQAIRKKYDHVVGVHIRQGDYEIWHGGKYFINLYVVKAILNEYLVKQYQQHKRICFIISSDEYVDQEIFKGLDCVITEKNMIEDLFILSKTDVIIGSNSTFGAFASYYGNIPHIVMQNGPMDWNYYEDKCNFFESKYLNWSSWHVSQS